MMKLATLTSFLETIAPLAYQESYDNSGLICGNPEMEITGALVCLDSTEAVIDEAIAKGINLVIAHHPLVFSGLKKFTGRTYVERTLLKAIQNNIAIYAIHTNLDNVQNGVNREIGERLGLKELRILSPKTGLLKKLVTFVPEAHAEKVRAALFESGAGKIGNYGECSFNVNGTGTFKGEADTQPFVGTPGIRHQEQEVRIEVIFEGVKQTELLAGLRKSHPYEEIAFDIYPIENQYNNVGSGMIGSFEKPVQLNEFLELVKSTMKTGSIRYTASRHQEIQKVAVCGGSGSFLLKDAISAGAQAFITADFKYHQFFDAENKIVIADIGHYESEQYTKELIYKLLKEKFATFAVRLSELNTNPINYF